MNNTTTSASSTMIQEFIQEVHSNYVGNLFNTSALALFVYTTVLAMSQEVEYIWSSPKLISIPNLFYVFTRYGSLFGQAFIIGLTSVPIGTALCNGLANAQNVVFILVYIGVQGLLVARAYSLCQGNKIIAGPLILFYLGGLALEIYTAVTPGGCVQSFTDPQVALAERICTIVTDVLVFCACLWKVWGTWKLKRDTGIRGNNDLVSILIRQTVSRFCFVAVFTVTVTIYSQYVGNIVKVVTNSFQHSFSTILIADLTLDIRQQNFAARRATNITLPTIQIQSVLNYIHHSIIEEMGDHEIPTNTRSGSEDDDVNVSVSPDSDGGDAAQIEIQHEESV